MLWSAREGECELLGACSVVYGELACVRRAHPQTLKAPTGDDKGGARKERRGNATAAGPAGKMPATTDPAGLACPLGRMLLDTGHDDHYNVGIMAHVLGAFEQAVLLAVLRLHDEAYGRAILREVSERMERDVAAGAVHATLNRLEKRRLLTSHLGTGTPVRGGRARRFYRLHPQGLRALTDARTAADKLWRGFKLPLKGYP